MNQKIRERLDAIIRRSDKERASLNALCELELACERYDERKNGEMLRVEVELALAHLLEIPDDEAGRAT